MEAGFCCLFTCLFSILILLDTYKLPLYFLAKVKVKKEEICIRKRLHSILFVLFSGAKVIFLF